MENGSSSLTIWVGMSIQLAINGSRNAATITIMASVAVSQGWVRLAASLAFALFSSTFFRVCSLKVTSIKVWAYGEFSILGLADLKVARVCVFPWMFWPRSEAILGDSRPVRQAHALP